MQGPSRAALAAGQDTLNGAMQAGAEREPLAEGLFAAAAALDSSAALRRALTDPSRDPAARRSLVGRLFRGKVSEAAQSVLEELATARWSHERDLGDAAEQLAVEAVAAAAEEHQRLDSVEDELFRFGRIVAGSPDLREALTDRGRDAEDRAALAAQLLAGKVSPETGRLIRQLVRAPRGRRFDRALDRYLDIAAARRRQLTAIVTAAVPLDDRQRDRLAAALSSMYDRPVHVNVMLDPDVVGGIRVQIGDEVVDGTVLSRLDDARRRMAG
ncbi:MAG TPA: F0F1 ATP synthase subunit delta [Dermatophilaceae bacterium]|nr:F0F1 ATP synthase subunit delta [Dermatophilaceae bacterium]